MTAGRTGTLAHTLPCMIMTTSRHLLLSSALVLGALVQGLASRP